ncbi:MAG: PAS domain-containing protein, partial [Pseudomonadota bacterium]|nr:PAS domain-containing protein [Pseudomonadota bacterium]
MNTSTPQAVDRNLLETQVRELYRTSTLASLTSVLIATFLGAILWYVTDHTVLVAWYACICVIALARLVATWRYRNTSDPNPRFWLTLHTAGLFVTGLCWGAVLLFVVPVEERFHLISAIFVIAGLATASAGSMASVKHGFAVFSIPALLPGALKLIVLDENITVLIGCAICAFLVFIAMVALRIHEVILYSLRKQFESAKFVIEVQEVHEALIARYDDLDKQLKRSTQQILELQAQLDAKTAAQRAHADDADLRVKSDRFSYLLDKLHGGAWNYNLRTGEIRFSPQWLNMLGYQEDETYATMDFWKSLLHPDDADDVIDKLQAHISGGIPQYFSSH